MKKLLIIKQFYLFTESYCNIYNLNCNISNKALVFIGQESEV